MSTGLSRLRLRPRALPGRDLAQVDLTATFLGHRLRAPLLISCMTGGTSAAGRVNVALAEAAQAHGVAIGLGSGRVLLEGGDVDSFDVRQVAPDVPLLANLGAVQLPSVGVDGCRRLVELTHADALVLHLNAVQEAVQPGGDTDFGGLERHIAGVVAGLGVPVVVKEVGFGLSAADVEILLDAGVAAVDVAGAGGTNWARVEGLRDDQAGRVAAAFADWGLPTADSVRAAAAVIRARDAHTQLVASGGLADGVDVAKCLALGADVGGVGRSVLAPGAAGPESATAAIGTIIEQLRIAVWATGAGSVRDLGADHLVP